MNFYCHVLCKNTLFLELYNLKSLTHHKNGSEVPSTALITLFSQYKSCFAHTWKHVSSHLKIMPKSSATRLMLWVPSCLVKVALHLSHQWMWLPSSACWCWFLDEEKSWFLNQKRRRHLVPFWSRMESTPARIDSVPFTCCLVLPFLMVWWQRWYRCTNLMITTSL